MQSNCLFLYLLPQIRRSIICKYTQLNSCANRKHINIPIIPILFVIVISKMPNIRIVAYSIFERMKEFIFSLTNNDVSVISAKVCNPTILINIANTNSL